jgi:hypothetical protein
MESEVIEVLRSIEECVAEIADFCKYMKEEIKKEKLE